MKIFVPAPENGIAANQREVPPTGIAPAGGCSGAILIADGNPNTLPTLPASLRSAGYETVTAEVFVQSAAVRHKAAVIIIGTNLPADVRESIIAALRARVDTAAIPVIVLTAPTSNKAALLAAGADRCLDLPISDSEVAAAVRACLDAPRKVAGAPAQILRDPARLAALNATHLLDSDPDPELDAVTKLAAQLLKTPLALVSLLDDRRQFFKSAAGLPPPLDKTRGTLLDFSFCQWVVSSSDDLQVEDARVHPVLRSNRAVSDLGVVAYLGVPLSAAGGETLGSFCAIDTQPHAWHEDDVAIMRDLARIVDAYIALNSPLPPEYSLESLQRRVRAAARAAGRGLFGAAHLMRASRKRLSEDDFSALLAFVETLSGKLVDLGADKPTRS